MVTIKQQPSKWGSDQNIVTMRASQLFSMSMNSLIEDLQTFGNTFTSFSPIDEQVVLIEDPNLGLEAVESASSKRGFGSISQDSFNETIEYKFQSFSYIGTANLLSIATRAETPISDADYNISTFKEFTPANEKKLNTLNNLISIQKTIFAYHNPMFDNVNANIFETKVQNRNLINVMYNNVGLLDNSRVVVKQDPIEITATTTPKDVRDSLLSAIHTVRNYNNGVMIAGKPQILITLTENTLSALEIMFSDITIAYGQSKFFEYMQSVISTVNLYFRVEKENIYTYALDDLKMRNSEHPLVMNSLRKFEEDVLGSITITNVSANSAILLSPFTHPIKIKKMREEAGHLTNVYDLTTYMMALPLMTTMEVLTLEQQESGNQIRSVIIPFTQTTNRIKNVNKIKTIFQPQNNQVKPLKSVKQEEIK